MAWRGTLKAGLGGMVSLHCHQLAHGEPRCPDLDGLQRPQRSFEFRTTCPGIAVDAGDRYVSAITKGSSRATRAIPRGNHPHAKPKFCAACGSRRSLKPAALIKRAAGIEPASSAWKAEVLPLHNARTSTDKLPLLKGGVCVSTPSL